jgi:hypothetical protein
VIQVPETDKDLPFDPAELYLSNPIGMTGVQRPHLPKLPAGGTEFTELNPEQKNVVQALEDQSWIASTLDPPQAARDQPDPLLRVAGVPGVKSFGNQRTSGVMEITMPAIQPISQVKQAEGGRELALVTMK